MLIIEGPGIGPEDIDRICQEMDDWEASQETPMYRTRCGSEPSGAGALCQAADGTSFEARSSRSRYRALMSSDSPHSTVRLWLWRPSAELAVIEKCSIGGDDACEGGVSEYARTG